MFYVYVLKKTALAMYMFDSHAYKALLNLIDRVSRR